MTDSKYKLCYLTLFYVDLSEKIMYIRNVLQNPQAANNLLDSVEKAIQDRRPVAEAWKCVDSFMISRMLKGYYSG